MSRTSSQRRWITTSRQMPRATTKAAMKTTFHGATAQPRIVWKAAPTSASAVASEAATAADQPTRSSARISSAPSIGRRLR
jgi:hypothetical protein